MGICNFSLSGTRNALGAGGNEKDFLNPKKSQGNRRHLRQTDAGGKLSLESDGHKVSLLSSPALECKRPWKSQHI